ncbi:MAG: cysteine--tRNA ligase [Candidatus Campbellbacteria bacterium]|nr:cysteine--tRNA ligase [Candidatus Campbellbacteria bacterium]
MLTFYNTLTREQEPFEALSKPHVGMYNCGPTVYDRVHIGNLRAYVFADTLRRVLSANGYDVQQVMNITDVGHLSSDADSGEDKMTKGLKREGLPMTLVGMRELAEKYTRAFEEDLVSLNILHPHELPRATDNIPEQIDIIKRLEEKGFTYVIADDGVYFDTEKDPHYGRLGGLTPLGDVRTDAESSQKHGPRDFALWKFNQELGWESPWGKGFPGWHIECSAMSMKYLGETFDIHTGGIDHIPVHHNNEIAQSENATGKPFARFWLHNAFLNIDNEKIAKSLGNAIVLSALVEKGITPLAYRYWLLTGHYRSEMNFTMDALLAGQNAYLKLVERVRELGEDVGTVNDEYYTHFMDAVNDDLGTPQAIAVLWDLFKNDSVSSADKKATILAFDTVLGLQLDAVESVSISADVQKLLDAREQARIAKDWKASDDLRADIEKLGFDVKDTSDGQKIIPKNV